MMGRIATRAGAPVLFLCLAFAHTSYAGTIEDNFNDNSLNTSIWGTWVFNYGSVSEVNQRIEEVVPNHSGWAEAGLAMLSLVGGDFDVRVDVAVLDFSGQSGGSITYGGGPVEICGHSLDVGLGGDGYYARFCDGTYYVPSSDTSGTLRLTRSGSTYSGYFWDGSNWQLIHSSPGGPTGDYGVSMSSHSADGSSGVAYDNFYLQTGPLTSEVPEPGTLLLGVSGVLLGGLIARAFRRRNR